MGQLGLSQPEEQFHGRCCHRQPAQRLERGREALHRSKHPPVTIPEHALSDALGKQLNTWTAWTSELFCSADLLLLWLATLLNLSWNLILKHAVSHAFSVAMQVLLYCPAIQALAPPCLHVSASAPPARA